MVKKSLGLCVHLFLFFVLQRGIAHEPFTAGRFYTNNLMTEWLSPPAEFATFLGNPFAQKLARNAVSRR